MVAATVESRHRWRHGIAYNCQEIETKYLAPQADLHVDLPDNFVADTHAVVSAGPWTGLPCIEIPLMLVETMLDELQRRARTHIERFVLPAFLCSSLGSSSIR